MYVDKGGDEDEGPHRGHGAKKGQGQDKDEE